MIRFYIPNPVKDGVDMDSELQKSPVKFNNSFTPEIDSYIERCRKEDQKPSIHGFAIYIGTDEDSIWAWATKHKKDENGVVTDQLARPNFFAAVKRLEKAEKEYKKTLIEEIKKEIKEEELNERQERFCQLYATDREFFGNGVQTYIEVYEPDQSKPNWYKRACSSASEILSNPKVFNRINELLEDGGLNDVNVDKQLVFLINQQADFGSKIAAIREYNKLKSRVTEKINHLNNGKDFPQPIYGGKSGETV